MLTLLQNSQITVEENQLEILKWTFVFCNVNKFCLYRQLSDVINVICCNIPYKHVQTIRVILIKKLIGLFSGLEQVCNFPSNMTIIYFTILLFNCVNTGQLLDSFDDVKDYEKHVQTKNRLLNIANKIRANKDTFRRTSSELGMMDYINQFYVNYTEGLPVMIKVIGWQISRNQFGNYFGMLLNDYACAYVSRAHMLLFIESADTKNYVVHSVEAYLPVVVVHQNPADVSIGKELAKTCGPYPFPWESGGSVFFNEGAISTVRKIVNHAINSIGYEHHKNKTTIKKHKHDHIHSHNAIEVNFTYPISGDVAIHYRCSDNVRFSGYGLLPFPTIISLIPPAAKYIYVHTEGTHEGHLCHSVVKALFEDIEKAFPTAYVVLFVKNAIFETMYDFINTRLALICSSSTFCFHAALGKVQGDIYMPRTWYGGQSNFSYPSWHYIEQKSRSAWPDEIFNSTNNYSYFIKTLRNLTLYNNI